MSKTLDLQSPTPSGKIVRMANIGILFAEKTAAPVNAIGGYAPGCLVIDRTNGNLYINKGTKASATWVLVGLSATGDLAVVGNLAVTGTSLLTGNVTLSALLLESAADNLTALGTTQADALQLTKEVNRITVGAAATGVLLPAAAPGLSVYVINSIAANSIHVYGNGTDTINDVATATGIVQMQNSVVLYVCSVAGKWYAEGIGGGYAGQLATILTTPAVTANPGGTQAGAVLLTAGYNRISVCATLGDSVRLPAAVVGSFVTINNRGAQPAQVFGLGADTINGIATATGVSHGVNQIATYFCAVAGNWEVQFGLPQQAGVVALTTNGAINPHVAHTYAITKAGVLADTLAAPTAGTDDGLVIIITSDTANAHTLTATGLLDTGSASVNLATFAANKGAGLTLMAYNGRWKVICSVGITFT